MHSEKGGNGRIVFAYIVCLWAVQRRYRYLKLHLSVPINSFASAVCESVLCLSVHVFWLWAAFQSSTSLPSRFSVYPLCCYLCFCVLCLCWEPSSDMNGNRYSYHIRQVWAFSCMLLASLANFLILFRLVGVTKVFIS